MIEFLLHQPATELRREGMTLFRSAGALRGARRVEGGYAEAPLGLRVISDREVEDFGLWREPTKGVLMLRPSPLRPDWLRGQSTSDDFVGTDRLVFQTGDLIGFRDADRPELLGTLHRDREDPLEGIAAPSGYGDLDVAGAGLTWVAQTTFAFAPNEVFSLVLQYAAKLTDRDKAVAGIAFGGIWFLLIDTVGTGSLYQNVGSSGAEEWVLRASLSLRDQSHVSSGTLQLTVVPWGLDCLSFIVNTAPDLFGVAEKVDFGSRRGPSGLFETRRHGYEPPWSSEMRQTIKTKAGPIAIACPTDETFVAFLLARGRYDEAGFAVMPEWLDEPRPSQVPQVEALGFWGQRSGSGESGASVFPGLGSSVPGLALMGHTGEPWNSADYGMVATGWLKPSADGLYSPELWGIEYSVLAETETTSEPEVLAGSRLQRVSGELSVHPEPGLLVAELAGTFEDEAEEMLSLGGRMALRIDDVEVASGYLKRRDAELEGVPVPMARQTLVCEDLWSTANRVSAAFFPPLSGLSFATVFRIAFERMGVPENEVEIDPDLEFVEIDGFVEGPSAFGGGSSGLGVGDDWKIIHENGSIGDLFRALIRRFQVQGETGSRRELRVRRSGGVWRVGFSPEWSASSPFWRFLLEDSLAGEVESEEARWAACEFRVLSSLRVRSERPKVSALRAYAAIGAGVGADAAAAFIAPLTVDLESADYVAFAEAATLGTPETALASTRGELERMARSAFAANSWAPRRVRLEAEWRPEIEPDQFVALLMRDSAGEPASLGAWRIESVAFDLRASAEGWTWRGDYALVFAGETDLEGYPMLDLRWPTP